MDRTIEFVKDRYNEEQGRFKHVEEKSARMLTFLTVVISFLIAVGSIKSNQFLSPQNEAEWIRILIYGFTIFSVFCAWGHALLALKVGDSPVVPISRKAAQYVKNANEDERDLYIFDCYADTTELLSIEINKKIKNLELSYSELTLSAWGVALILLASILMEFLQ